MDEQLTHFQQQYRHLRTLRDAGQLHPQQFVAEVQKLRWQDKQGMWWMIDPDGVALRYDGQHWVAPPPRPVAPPSRPAPPATSAAPAQVGPSPQSRPPKASFLRATSPILAIIPALLCGGLWFLYTFIGVFKYEGISGIDFITPVIVGGLPILFWILKKPLDQLLLPLKPLIQSAPKPLRLGVTLAIPVFLGCGCSTLSPSGYFALSVSAFISVITAAVLLRY